MQNSGIRFAAVLLLGAAAACDREAPPAARLEPQQPPADYTRHLLFVAAPPARDRLVIELLAQDRGDSVHHRARAWAYTVDGWIPALAEQWSTPGIRSAWRALPHGNFRIAVGPNDAIESIRIRRPNGVIRLVLRSELRNAQPDPGRTLILRQAELESDGGGVAGAMLDVQQVRVPGAAAQAMGVEAIALVVGQRTQLGHAGGTLLWGGSRRLPRRPQSAQLHRTADTWLLTAGARRETSIASFVTQPPHPLGDGGSFAAGEATLQGAVAERANALVIELRR